MIKVEKSANTLDEGIKNLMAKAKKTMKECQLETVKQNCLVILKNKLKLGIKKQELCSIKYIKIVQDTGVFCFIAKEDFKHFKKGDILKAAAGYNKPALNSPRGNILSGNYPIQWTGLLYLK